LSTVRSRREYCVLPFENFKSLKIIFFKKVDGFRPRRHVVRDRLSQSRPAPRGLLAASGSRRLPPGSLRSLTLIVLVVVDNHRVATLDLLVVYHHSVATLDLLVVYRHSVATFLAPLGGTVFEHLS
jgi:hypothetical protein